MFFFSSRRRHTRCALVTGVQTCALPITSDPRVDMVAFTGSAPNGSRVAEVGSKTLKRLLLELGGKSAFDLHESADVAQQAALAAKTICANAGQGCVARSREIGRAHV